MKKIVTFIVVFAILLSIGCVYSNVTTPFDTDLNKTSMGQKTGRASTYSVLWLFAWGDSGVAAAVRNGGITTVNHMDAQVTFVFFGLITRTTTIVYGD